MPRTLAFLTARPSRRPHEWMAWLAAVCLIVVAAGLSPWVPWPGSLGVVVAVAFGCAAVVIAVCAWSAMKERS